MGGYRCTECFWIPNPGSTLPHRAVSGFRTGTGRPISERNEAEPGARSHGRDRKCPETGRMGGRRDRPQAVSICAKPGQTRHRGRREFRQVLRVPAHPGPSLDARDDGGKGGACGFPNVSIDTEKKTTRHPERRARDLGGWGRAERASEKRGRRTPHCALSGADARNASIGRGSGSNHAPRCSSGGNRPTKASPVVLAAASHMPLLVCASAFGTSPLTKGDGAEGGEGLSVSKTYRKRNAGSRIG